MPKAKTKPKKKLKKKPVVKATKGNGKKLGGCTGKGFMPGVSGNPAGAKKKIQKIPDILMKIGMQPGTKDGKMTKLDVVMERVFKFAVEGRPWAVEFIANRTEGKPRQQIDINLEDKRPKFTGKNPTKFLNEYINFQNAEA